MNDLVVLGKYELVQIPELGKKDVKAKVDSGAKTCSIHASNIRVRKKNGVSVLECFLLGDHSKKVSFENFSTRIVKSSNGISQTRYAVKLKAKVFRRTYMTEFTLSNRTSMRFPILLGRRFLRKRYLIDVSKAYHAAELLGRQNPDKRYLSKSLQTRKAGDN
jgi:hypothetical protein